ncbi:hypothetical protein GFV12_03060 [Desulfurobacterium thermolithotrophum]|uniref:hypothetical protein n=1 Tax=Desulfurobacterium thermolithotrophum TaxID=64160 RepID=UPI0013D24D20|nr:hypothetical protein [Desulfurobacterium thermolithotrophum]
MKGVIRVGFEITSMGFCMRVYLNGHSKEGKKLSDLLTELNVRLPISAIPSFDRFCWDFYIKDEKDLAYCQFILEILKKDFSFEYKNAAALLSVIKQLLPQQKKEESYESGRYSTDASSDDGLLSKKRKDN